MGLGLWRLAFAGNTTVMAAEPPQAGEYPPHAGSPLTAKGACEGPRWSGPLELKSKPSRTRCAATGFTLPPKYDQHRRRTFGFQRRPRAITSKARDIRCGAG